MSTDTEYWTRYTFGTAPLLSVYVSFYNICIKKCKCQNEMQTVLIHIRMLSGKIH